MSILSSPYLLGFDHLERVMERAARHTGEGYPPYNVEQLNETNWRITIAVAGFTAGALSVEVEDNQLIIQGKQPEEGERAFVHRGIATRQFQRRFVLAEGVEVNAAALADGLLTIDLNQPLPDRRSTKIKIQTEPRKE